MNKIAFLIFAVIFLTFCGASRRQKNVYQNNISDRYSYPKNSENFPETRAIKQESRPFNQLLPYEKDKDNKPFSKFYSAFKNCRYILVEFPKKIEKQKCVNALFATYEYSEADKKGPRKINILSLAICFEDDESAKISTQMSVELKILANALKKDSENLLRFFRLREIKNFALMEQRIITIRNFLLKENTPLKQVVN